MASSLENEYILEHLFGFLNLEDTKSCRLVARLWRDVGEMVLRRKSQVIFDFEDRDRDTEFVTTRNKMTEFGDYCIAKNNEQESTPFSAFTFRGYIQLPIVEEFLKRLKDNVTKISILGSVTIDDGFDMNKLIGSHLKSVTIGFRWHRILGVEGNRFSLSLDLLPFVEELYLDHCIISLAGSRRYLKKISLGPKNKYIRGGIELEKLVVNEYFDLTCARFISLQGNKIIFNLFRCGNPKIKKEVSLMGNVEVNNWALCDWNLKKLTLAEVPFQAKNSMKIQEMDASRTTVDLSLIHSPEVVKKLCLKKCNIILRDNMKRLSPTVCNMSFEVHNTFTKNGITVPKFYVQEVIEFNLLKSLSLTGGRNIVLDFGDSTTESVGKEYVSLQMVDVTNWSNCDWKVRHLKLHQVPFLENNLMEIEEIFFDYTEVDVSVINKPSLVKKFHLDHCQVIFRENTNRISPKEVHLGENIKFALNDQHVYLDEVVINDIIDFREASRINLEGRSIRLNLADCRGNKDLARDISLKKVKVLNWEKSNWKVAELQLNGVPFIEKTAMEIEQISIIKSTVDFSAFEYPSAVKKISCKRAEMLQKHFFFPNLMDLELKFCSDINFVLPLFFESKNMVKLKLLQKNGSKTVNMQNLPTNLRMLTLRKVNVEIGEVFPLKILFLEKYGDSITDYEQVLTKFKPECLIVLVDGVNKHEPANEIVNFIKKEHSFKRLLIGDFFWSRGGEDTEFLFKNSEFSKFADKEGESFEFFGQSGTAISPNSKTGTELFNYWTCDSFYLSTVTENVFDTFIE